MRPVRMVVCTLAILIVYGLVGGALASAQDGQAAAQPVAAATVPRVIRISGSVKDGAGNALTGNTQITFALFADQNDQQAIWQESQNVPLDANGHYSVFLGGANDTGLPLEIFTSGQARWLGVRPEGQAEQPRILFLSVAYALKSADSDMLGGLPASAFVLAGSQNFNESSSNGLNSNEQGGVTAQVVAGKGTGGQGPSTTGLPLLVSPRTACAAVTSDGTATANQIGVFTTACNVEGSVIYQSSGNVGIGISSPSALLDVNGTALVAGLLTAAGAVITPSGTATTTQGYISNPLDLEASVYNTSLSRGVNYIFQWQAEPLGNDTAGTSASLNLLYGVSGSISETGLSVAKNGIISFASGQTFPGSSGTVTSVATGAGLTGGPITTTGTISIPSAGVTNAMLANSAATVNGQSCTLGSTCTVTAAPSGTAGGALSGSYPNPTVAAGAITNAMLANNSVTVTAGSGLSGGGTVALGGTVTITNASPSSGGTVTSVASGTGLSGGPITTSGTLSLNTTYLNGLYLQLAGGTLTGGLSGTTGTFSGLLSAMGAVMPTTGTATTSKGYISNPFDLQTSAYSSTSAAAVTQDFRWQAEPSGNDTSSASGTLNLLFGSNGTTPAETGLSVAHTGIITFASGQTFPGSGSGTVTNVATGAGLTGGPITSSGTISIPSAGVTNAMLANNSVTVTAGSGLSGGGTVALGGTVTITNASPSSGGTVTSVATGTGLSGGPITTSGTLSLNTTYLNGLYLQLAGGTLTGGLSGTTGTFSGGLAATTGTFSGLLSAMGSVLPTTGTATTSKGYISNPFDLQTSSYSSTSTAAVTQDFRWQAEPSGNDTSSASGTLNLLFGSNGTTPAETGLSVAHTGIITFASGQTFPGSGGSGTVTSVATGAGLTGGPITASGTISIPSAGVTNAMLANSSSTVNGQGCALGSTCTVTAAPSGTAGGSLSGSYPNPTVAAGAITNAMLANNSVTVTAGSGLSGGGTIALGGTVTITNASPSSGGTVTSIATGTGLSGGPITTSGTLSLNTTYLKGLYLQLAGGTLTGGLNGTTGTFSGLLSAMGALLPTTGTATTSQGYISNPFDLQTSSYSSTSAAAVTQDFRWQAEPSGNDTSSASGTLNLLFGSNGATPAETGLSVAHTGIITFASGQTFPGSGGSGTVTSVATGAGLTGGPITASGTISIPSAGVTNAMLANSSSTVNGQSCTLGSPCTVTAAPSGTAGGALSGSYPNPTVAAGAITNAMLANNAITVTAGSGLSGGGTVALGGTVTITNASPSSGGTVTSVASGTGLSGGPITTSGTLSLNTTYLNGLYLQLAGGTLTGGLSGTSGTFSGGLSATTGTFSGLLSAMGAVMPTTGTATTSKGYISNPFDLQTSAYSSTSAAAVTQDFRWQAEPSGNDTTSASGTLNLLFGSNGTTPAETGLSIGHNGVITFASGQTFPGSGGSGTVTSVATGAGLTGGPITSTGTISIPSAGVTNAMLANSSSTVNGQSCALGGTCTVTAAPSGTAGGSLSGSYPNPTVATGAISNAMLANSSSTVNGQSCALGATCTVTAAPKGTAGGSLSGSYPNPTVAAGAITNAMLANNSVTVTAGSGLSGGGTIALGGTVTITNASPSSGGTVTSVATGTGLSGGPITTSGTLSLNTTYLNGLYLQLAGGTLTGGLSGTTGTFSGLLSAMGALLPTTGTATTSQGYISNPFDLQTSSYSSTSAAAVTQDFRWQAEPSGNDTTSASGTLNLLFGSNGTTPSETGLAIGHNGVITFAAGQTFPGSGGSGTVTSVATGAGLTGGPITSTGTISIPSAGVTNAMLANSSSTVNGQTCALGGTCTVTAAPSGTAGGTLSGSYPNPTVATGAITNAMLANNAITVTAGSGLSGGGTVALGGTVTITNVSPGMGGTVSSVGTGSGILGGPITTSGTLTLDTSFTNGLYLQLAGGTLTGGLNGTTGTFSGGLSATTGSFSGLLSAAAGAQLPGAGTATAAQGYNSNPLDLQASVYNSSTAAAVPQDFFWQAEPSQNDSSSPSATLNLLFGSNGSAPAETGLSVANNGIITFANGQTFPSGGGSAGTVTSVGTGPGLTGGPVTTSGTISIATGGVSNVMLANNSVTVAAGTGLSGGGTVPLGGTVTLNNTGVTSVATGAGLTGGPITSTGTISIPSAGVTNTMLANNSVTVAAGSGLSGGGTVALGGTISLAANLSGSSNGVAYFSSPTSVTSTAAPTNGQVLVGSTGNAPALATLTAGQNVSITNGPGSITISASGGGGGALTLPYFATAGGRTGVAQAATKNAVALWGFLLPYGVTTTQVTYDISKVDDTANDYDIGIYNNAGTLMVDLGPTAGTTFAPAKGFRTRAWSQGSTSLPAGRYYLALTTNCAGTCAAVEASTANISFAINASAGATTGGALLSTVSPPADSWNTGYQPSVVIH